MRDHLTLKQTPQKTGQMMNGFSSVNAVPA
jgi:hypothetical protein